MQRHKYFHLQQMAIKKRPLSNVDAHLLFIAYCVFILFFSLLTTGRQGFNVYL